MGDALDEFVIRGVASNVVFQSALVRHPRFLEGRLTTAFIAEEFPHGFRAAAAPQTAAFLAAVAAAVHRNYRERAAGIEGQVKGHEVRIDGRYVVVGDDADHAATVLPADGGYDVRVGDRTFALRYRFRFGGILMRGTCNGEPFALQLERRGLAYRLTHGGAQAEVQVLPQRAAELLRLMPKKPPPDRSRFLLSPMPGLLAEVAVAAGQEVKAGQRLVVIEAMKMQNVIVAERDQTIGKVLAREGDSLAVDQPVIEFS
jgi:propionyl-CoA carboxylase alpha chain